MTVDPLEQLLVVQGHDTRSTQLRTRRQNLPERTEAAEVAAADRALADQLESVDGARHRLERDQARLDDEVASLRDKAAHAESMMYSGTITNPRELQGFQDEVASLGRRVGELEEREIEIMVEREPFDEQSTALLAQRAAQAERLAALATAITVAEAEIDAELETVTAARAEAAAGVPAELLEEYESIRALNGGIGISRLEHGTCGGCHMKLSAVEQARIKALPPDAPIHCEDCDRLLVR